MWGLILWIKEALRGLFRNFLMNSFALLLSIVCFAMLAFFTTIGINAKYISTNQEEKITVVLLLKDEVKNYQDISNKINDLKEVKSSVFVSKDEAFEEMKQSLGKREKMLTGLGFNPLPASFEIKLNNPRDVERVVKLLDSWGIDKDIKYGQEYLDNFFEVTDKITQLAFWVIIVMSVATGAVIYSSIRMNILNRNKEIEIKDLIGAGLFNIRIPFILEAVILTLISATIVLAIVYFTYDEMIYKMVSGIPITTLMSKGAILKNLLYPMYFMAIVIGVISSVISTQRYLKRH
ncbi:permease-like cell division protein FtsX [Bacillus mexicanus]|uniref:cell division protein FtsX n=1 Tax=Bacillus mexicanus TaxID=2834415 RepID=UPI003D196FAA